MCGLGCGLVELAFLVLTFNSYEIVRGASINVEFFRFKFNAEDEIRPRVLFVVRAYSVFSKMTLSLSFLNFRGKPAVQFAAVTALAACFSVTSQAQSDVMESFTANIEPILDQYCYDCHGYGSDKGGVVLDGFANAEGLMDHDLWLRAIKNMRSNIMPPEDEAQPSEEEMAELTSWIKEKVFVLNVENPDPGAVTVRRLNRIEYRNTVKDLIDIDYNTSNEFPADDTGHGFDNMGAVLTISPMLLEKYLDAAQTIIAQAVPTQSLVVDENVILGKVFLAEGESLEDSEGSSRDLSYYEAKTSVAKHEIKIDGEYEIVLDFTGRDTYVNNQNDLNECQFIFRIDGEIVLERKFVREGGRKFKFNYDRNWEVGEHEFSFEIIPLTPEVEQIRNLRLQVNNITVRGPLSEEHWVQPADYTNIFPKPVPNGKRKRNKYARELLSEFAYKAFRRPVEKDTLDRLVSLAERVANQKDGTFEAGIAQSMVAVLASPRFLFREESTLSLEDNQKHPFVDEFALASRLSYFLWTTMPDQELIGLAEKGELRDNLQVQVKRMLNDERSKGFVANFTGQWLQARDVESIPISDFAVWLRDNPDAALTAARKTFQRIRKIEREDRTEAQIEELAEARKIFFASFRSPKPSLNNDVRRAMRMETELVFEYILQNEGSVLDLIESDYTFLNKDLAEHYGIEGVEGEEMRKVMLAENSPRGGVLTQGTVLAVTSNPTRTSPVKRGVFLLDNILGTPPAPPPPNIPGLEDLASEEELAQMSLRETLALHAKKRLCRSCHNRMDPLGLALENFNAMGMWREAELDLPIEPEGQLITGEEFADIQELKRILVTDRKNDFYFCITEKIMTYALGREVEYYDTSTVDQLVQTLNETDGNLSTLIMGIIDSPAFQQRRSQDSTTTTEEIAGSSDNASEPEDTKS